MNGKHARDTYYISTKTPINSAPKLKRKPSEITLTQNHAQNKTKKYRKISQTKPNSMCAKHMYSSWAYVTYAAHPYKNTHSVWFGTFSFCGISV